MRKSEKNKIAGYIIKALLILNIVFWIVGIALRIINGSKDLVFQEKIDMFLAISLIITAIVIVILLCKYPNAIVIAEKIKPNKFSMVFENYSDFLDFIDRNIYKIKYKKYMFNKDNNITIYYKLKYNKLELFMVLNYDKFMKSEDDIFDYIDEHIRKDFINDMLRNYNYKVKSSTWLIENYLFFASQETKDFMNIVSTNTAGSYRQGILYSGYSLDKQTLYLSNQKDGAIISYKSARRRLLKLMNLKMKNQIKWWGILW